MNFIIFTLVLVAALTISANLFSLYWMGSMLLPIIMGGGPYVPTHPDIVQRMIQIARVQPDDVVVDLGSGDGRLLIAAMQAGAKRAVGYEIHPGLTRLANWKIKQAGFQKRARTLNRSMWNADLTDVTLVFLYQVPYAMKKMKKKFEHNLPPGARIVSHAFAIPGWKPEQTHENVFLYKITKDEVTGDPIDIQEFFL